MSDELLSVHEAAFQILILWKITIIIICKENHFIYCLPLCYRFKKKIEKYNSLMSDTFIDIKYGYFHAMYFGRRQMKHLTL